MIKQAAYAVAAATAFAAVPASAAHTFEGNITFTLGNCAQVCTGFFNNAADAPTFAHFYTLTLPNDGGVASQAGEVTVSGQNVDFGTVFLTAYDEVADAFVGPMYNFTVTNTVGAASQAVLSTVGPLGGGTYRIYLDGTSSNGGNGYNGTITLSAVPEPATWALFILGFGAVGHTMRRRSNKVRIAKASLNFA